MGHFEIFRGIDEQFYFHLKAANGEIIASSQGYTSKQSAESGIAAIRSTASRAEVIDLTLAVNKADRNR